MMIGDSCPHRGYCLLRKTDKNECNSAKGIREDICLEYDHENNKLKDVYQSVENEKTFKF